MKRRSRLNRSEDIKRVRQHGSSYVHDSLVLGCRKNPFDHNRYAIIAGKSVGNAVKRNFAKRRLRSATQHFQMEIEQGYDLVMIARRSVLKIEYIHLLDEFRALLGQADLLKETKVDK